MAPIASLVVRISGQISELQKSFADSTKAVEGFKSSFDRQAAAIQASIDGISKTFEQFGSVVGTIGVAAVGVGAGLTAIKAGFDGVQAVVSGAIGALSDAVNHTAELGDNLFALSQKTGVSVESLSAFKFVAAQTNTSLESISGAVFKLEANLGKGSKETTSAINSIGLSLKDLQAQDPADAFGQIIAKLGEIPNASDRAAAGVAIFGKSFKDIAQLSQEDLPALIKQAKDLGLVMSTETAVAADRFGDAMGALRGVFEGIQLQIGAKLLPALVAITETFGGVFIDGIKAATSASSGLGEVFDTVVVQIGQAIGRAIEILAKLTDATAAWVSDSTKRIADEARAFLDLAPSIIAVGRAFDLAFNAGTHSGAFDSLAKNLEALRKPLDSLQSVATSAGAKIREIAQGIATSAASAGQNFGATYVRIQGEIAAAADKMRASLKAAGDGGNDGANAAFKAFEKQLAELTAQIDRANEHGAPLSEMLKLFGDEASKSASKGAAWGITVKQSVQNVADSFNVLKNNKAFDELAADWAKVQEVFTDGAAKVAAATQALAQKEAGASAASLVRIVGDQQKAQDRLNEIGLSGLRLTLKNIADAQLAEQRSWGERIPQNAAAYDRLKALSDAYYDHERRLAVGTPDTLTERMHNTGVKTKAELEDIAAAAKRDYQQMKESGLYTYKQLEDAAARSGAAQKEAAGKVTSAWLKAFHGLSSELPSLISRGFEQGGVFGSVAAVAGASASKFGEVFAAGMARTGDVFKDLKFSEKFAGYGAIAAQSFATGFQSGLENPGTVSALTSVGSAFLTGLIIAGPIGAGVGAGIALAGFLAGAFKNAKEEAKALANEQAKLVTQFHGIEGLRQAAEKAGFSLPDLRGNQLSVSDSIEKIFRAPDAASFNKEIAALNASLDAYNEKLKAIASSTDALNRRTSAFSAKFEPLVTARKAATDSGDTGAAAVAGQQIKELAQRTQPEFERLGLFVRDTFGAIVKETGDAFAAITALAPSFKTLKDGISDFGLTSTAAIDSLIGSFDLVNNEAFKPFFENIQSSGQLLKGLFDAKALSPQTFQAAAADIGQSIQEIINRGGDMAKTYALSAPQLQTLWEAQQRYGAITDQTTQSILNQAVQQGIVGEQFRDVNEKILDVLLAIGDALGAVIPDGLRGLAAPAQEASDAITGSIGGAFDDLDGRIRTTGDQIGDGLSAKARAAGKDIQANIGGSLDGLVARSKSAADGISDNLKQIRAPKITIPVEFDDEALKRDWSWKGGAEWRPEPIPLATGGIVRRPTLALVGERGPEAVIPLARLAGVNPSRSPAPVVFEAGSIVLQGIDGPSIRKLVSSGEFAATLSDEIQKNPRGLGTAVRRAVPA